MIQTGHGSSTHPIWGVLLWLVVGWLLAGCGQVITRPTPTPTPKVAVPPRATPRPTATPAPYTPEPTPTPTVTPTPVIYVVQRGDNLLRIAGLYGISVEALQEANGITDPRRLQIGQELIIPQEEIASGEATPTPTPTPMPIEIENLTFHRAPTGELWCLGEVRNINQVPLEQVQIEIVLVDEAQKELARATTFVQADLIEAGERAPFVVQFDGTPPPFASYRIGPLSAVPAYIGSYYRDLEVRDTNGQGERYAAYRVTGRIVNVGPEEAVGVNVVVTVYDALGRVIGVRRGVPKHNVIPRGGDTTFRIEVVPIGGPVATYTVLAQGRRLPTPTPILGD